MSKRVIMTCYIYKTDNFCNFTELRDLLKKGKLKNHNRISLFDGNTLLEEKINIKEAIREYEWLSTVSTPKIRFYRRH